MALSMRIIVISTLFAGLVKESRGSCNTGLWGEDCERECAEGCYFNYACDEENGVCSRCIDGLYGPHCDSKCSENCIQCNQKTGLCTSCENLWYGNLCTKPCNSSNCHRCQISSGSCYSCKRGYWGTYCEKECISVEECLFNCDTSSNPNACEYACKCVSCNKNNGICSNCAAGFWGKGCYRQCPQNCASTCNFYDGRCHSCRPGYRGNKCQYECPKTCMTCLSTGSCPTCKKGYWGESCENRCSHCASCHNYYGYCTECRQGYWGSSCTYKCPDDCTCCNVDTGVCNENGCVSSDSEGTGLESKQDTTKSIIGIAAIIVGFILCVICVTLALVIIRQLKNNQQNDRKDLYSQHQTGCQNDLELYENPTY